MSTAVSTGNNQRFRWNGKVYNSYAEFCKEAGFVTLEQMNKFNTLMRRYGNNVDKVLYKMYGEDEEFEDLYSGNRKICSLSDIENFCNKHNITDIDHKLEFLSYVERCGSIKDAVIKIGEEQGILADKHLKKQSIKKDESIAKASRKAALLGMQVEPTEKTKSMLNRRYKETVSNKICRFACNNGIDRSILKKMSGRASNVALNTLLKCSLSTGQYIMLINNLNNITMERSWYDYDDILYLLGMAFDIMGMIKGDLSTFDYSYRAEYILLVMYLRQKDICNIK